MDVPLMVVDAFAERPFTGNPAGVCLLHRPADDAWMQHLAGELGFSETAFVDLSSGEVLDLRWFTPEVEVDLCGHATLASAHVLWETGIVARGQAIAFATHSGRLAVDDHRGLLELDLPAATAEDVATPPGLAEVLGTPVVRTAESRRRGVPGDLLVEVTEPQAVANLSPDLATLGRLPHRAVIVTAPAEADADYCLRVFGPRIGIPEDPATGSAHCLLGPWWAGRLGRGELEAWQLSPRGGRFRVRAGGERVAVAGAAVTVLRGTVTPVEA